MLPVRRLALSAAAVAAAATGVFAAAGCSGPSYAAPGPGSSPSAAAPSHTATAPQHTPSASAPASHPAQQPSKGHKGSAAPWDSILLRYSVHGRTLTYQMFDAGYQHLYQAPPDNHDFAWHESAGVQLTFGDGHQTGANGAGGMRCSQHGIVPFRDNFPRATHHYAKPGTYRLTFTSYYCGATGNDKVSKTYVITVH